MKIPNIVKIGYKTYKVNKVKSDVIDGNKVCYGNICYETGDINYSIKYPLDIQQCTFIHEILHGINDIVEADLTEDQVRKMSKGLYDLIISNPKMF